MKLISLRSLLFAAGLAGLGVSLASAQGSSTMPTTMPPAVKPVLPPLPPAIQALVDQFTTNRDALIAARQAVLAQLKTATPDQRKAIIAALQAQNKDLIAQERALAKQIRDELRQLRKSQPKPGGG